jgi:hypothetical protein
MSNCFLQRFGSCRGKLSKDHYLSEAILRQVTLGRTATIGGLPWQPALTLKDVGIPALQAKILCEGHNSGLSELDSAAASLFRTLDLIDKHPESVRSPMQFHGPLVERWFLKVVCGLVAGEGMSGGTVPEEWKQALTGGDWPEGWGLYCLNRGPQIFVKDIQIETRVHPETKKIHGVEFYFGGVWFYLRLGEPDRGAAFGVYHPGGLIFQLPDGERRIQFSWPSGCNEWVVYAKVGTTSDDPPHRLNWCPP